jgi:hypothetical protein
MSSGVIKDEFARARSIAGGRPRAPGGTVKSKDRGDISS